MVVGDLIDISNRLGISWPDWAETTTDVFTIIVVVVVLYFLLRWINLIKEQHAETSVVEKAIKTPGGGRTAAGAWAALRKVRDRLNTLTARLKAGENIVKKGEKKREAITQIGISRVGENEKEKEELQIEKGAETKETASTTKLGQAEGKELTGEELITQEQQAAAAIVAGVEDVAGAGETITKQAKTTIAQEEAEQQQLATEVAKLESFSELNSTTLKYLFGVLQELKPQLEQQVKTEEEDVTAGEKQYADVKQTVTDLRTIIRSLLPETRKTKSNSKKALQNLKKAIEDARREREKYNEELQKELKAPEAERNQQKIAEIQQKIDHFDENMPLLKQLQRSTEQAEAYLLQQLKELQTAEKAARKLSGSLNRTEKKVKKNVDQARDKVKELIKSKTKLDGAIDKLEYGSNVSPLVISVLEKLTEYLQNLKTVWGFDRRSATKDSYIAVVPFIDEVKKTIQDIKKIEDVEKTIVRLTGEAQIVLARAFHDEVSGELEAVAGGLKEESILLEYEEKLDDALLAILEQAKNILLAVIQQLEENKKRNITLSLTMEALNTKTKKVIMDTIIPLFRKKIELREEYKQKADEFGKQLDQTEAAEFNKRIAA